ncbi:MAG: hypothetical protein R3F43_21455 [bacterium]
MGRDAADQGADVQAEVHLDHRRPGHHAVALPVYAWTDAVAGERVHPLIVPPPVTATFDDAVALVPAGQPARTRVVLRASTARRGPGHRCARRAGRLQRPAGPGAVHADGGRSRAIVELTTAKAGAAA